VQLLGQALMGSKTIRIRAERCTLIASPSTNLISSNDVALIGHYEMRGFFVVSLTCDCCSVLSDSATPSNLNASNFLTGKDNIMFNPIFGMFSSRAIQSIPDMIGYL